MFVICNLSVFRIKIFAHEAERARYEVIYPAGSRREWREEIRRSQNGVWEGGTGMARWCAENRIPNRPVSGREANRGPSI